MESASERSSILVLFVGGMTSHATTRSSGDGSHGLEENVEQIIGGKLSRFVSYTQALGAATERLSPSSVHTEKEGPDTMMMCYDDVDANLDDEEPNYVCLHQLCSLNDTTVLHRIQPVQ
jgi:hypothetical protein